MTSHTPVKVGILCNGYDILTILLFILDFIYIWNRAMHVKLNIKIYIYREPSTLLLIKKK